jgi:hypothetical protein
MADNVPIDAGAPEIEPTPEMIEAGMEAIYSFFADAVMPRSEILRQVATEVYQAMESRRLSESNVCPLQIERACLDGRDTT